MNKINMVSNKNNSPEIAIKDAEIIFSDSGQVQAMMKSPVLYHYSTERSYVEMPKGIKVFFYDTAMNIDAHLSANYAINYEKEKIMSAKNNVVVVNTKGEQLNTEHLVWNQYKRIIYSDAFVKIKTKDEILFGKGMESDDMFNKWTIKNLTGTITVKNY